MSGYLANHPGVLWLMSGGLFTVLWAHLAGLEYGRRDAAARAAARRIARTSRSAPDGPSAVASSGGRAAACRRCPGLRDENAALREELRAAQRHAGGLRDQLSSQPPRELAVPGEQTTQESI